MRFPTKQVISKLLEGRHFRVAVDLGCGIGMAGEILKPHCNILIGVDHNLGRLSTAKEFGGYDEVVHSDVREYQLPINTEAIFMFDLIEHLPKKDGFDLLLKTRNVPFIMLTTPSKYFPIAINGHATVWTLEELVENRFKVMEYSLGFYDLLYGSHIVAIKTT